MNRPFPRPWSGRTWAVSFALFAGLLGGWAVATPLFGQPDEPAHYLKAADVARGSLLAEADPGRPDGPSLVLLPRALAAAEQGAQCFAFRPEVTPDCVDAPTGPERSVALAVVPTQAGRYPPAYYAATGWPTLLRPSADGLYAVRAVSALLCSALLATALTAATVTGRRLLVLAVGVATSPMVVFLGSGVNPGSVEIAAAIAFWTAGLALATSRGRPQRVLVAAVGLPALLLVLSRPISPFWAALIGLVLVGVSGRRLPELLRSRALQVWTGLLVVAALAQTGWVLATGALDLSGRGLDLTREQALEGSWDRTGRRAQELVGLFGWLDAPAPRLTTWLWVGAAVAVLLLGLWRAAPWRVVLLLVVAAGVLVLPVVLEVRSVQEVGFYWQGRYTLPLAVGAPLLAGVLRRTAPGRSRAVGAVLAVVAAGLALAHVAAFVVTLARYTVGADRGLGLLATQWEPPVPVHLLVPAFVLTAVGYAVWLLRAPLGRPERSGTLEPCASSSPAVPASSAPTTSVRC